MSEKTLLALQLIVPYLVDPTTCGYNYNYEECQYITPDGKMCVAGKCMLHPSDYRPSDPIDKIILDSVETGQPVFKSEYVNKFTPNEWRNLQSIHDVIATGQEVSNFDFFTPEQLIIYVIVNDLTLSHSITYNT